MTALGHLKCSSSFLTSNLFTWDGSRKSAVFLDYSTRWGSYFTWFILWLVVSVCVLYISMVLNRKVFSSKLQH